MDGMWRMYGRLAGGSDSYHEVFAHERTTSFFGSFIVESEANLAIFELILSIFAILILIQVLQRKPRLKNTSKRMPNNRVSSEQLLEFKR
jgi:hypothetical protein